MYKSIFLRENEKDIFKALQDQNIEIEILQKYLSQLFNRVYNNYVGYYIFKQDDIVYKLIILPKTIDINSLNAEKEFVDYLLQYYRIKNIHKIDNEKNIPNSILQLAFESNNSNENSHKRLEVFQSYKYRTIIQDIDKFFKRHKNSKRIKVNYVSQSIKYKLNLKDNITELNRTKIHQIQNIDILFSILATITFYSLNLLLSQKYMNIYGDRLIRDVKNLKSNLLKKFNIEKGYKFSLSILHGLKTTKLFSKTKDNKQLLVDIKSLFGFEQMYKDKSISIDYRQDLITTSLFINPNNFYEWYVYDVLKKYSIKKNKIIIFDKQEGTKTEYFLNKMKKSSNPDYILIDEDKKIKIVIDAKWKNINDFADIKSSDYMKLKFDVSLLEGTEYQVCSLLVYPHINIRSCPPN